MVALVGLALAEYEFECVGIPICKLCRVHRPCEMVG